jgi:hypothetical protein
MTEKRHLVLKKHRLSLNIVVVSFIGGGNRSTRRKPLTYHKSLANFIIYVQSTPHHEQDSNSQLRH